MEPLPQDQVNAKVTLALKDLIDGIENGEYTVRRGRSGKIMTQGKGKQKPQDTGLWGFEIHYQKKGDSSGIAQRGDTQ